MLLFLWNLEIWSYDENLLYRLMFIFTLYTYINFIFIHFLLIFLFFYQIRLNIFQRFDFKI